MRSIYRLTILFLIFTLLFSCIEKTYFTEEEMQWLNIYNKGDILIFQETGSLQKDTTYIIKKEVFHGGFEPMSSDKIENIGRIWYRNKNIRSGFRDFEPEEQLLAIYKHSNEEPTYPFINYLHFTFILSEYNFNSKDLSRVRLLNINKIFDNVYTFHNKTRIYFDTKDSDPQTLYWDKQYGIIKYETYEGKVWERINWN